MTTIKYYEDTIHAIQEINKSLVDDLLTFKEDKKLMNVQLNSALAAREKLEIKYEKVKKELVDFKKRTEDQQANLGDLESEFGGIKEELENKKIQLNELIIINKRLEEMVKQLTMECDDIKDRLSKTKEFAGSVEERDQRIEKLTNELKDTTSKLSKFEMERNKTVVEETRKRVEAEQYAKGLEKRAQELEESKDRDSKILKETKEQAKQSLDETKLLLAKEKEEHKQLVDELNVYKTLLEREQGNREKVEEDTVAMKQQSTQVESDLKQVKQKSIDMEQEILKLKKEIDGRVKKEQELLQQFEKERDNNKRLQEDWNKDKQVFKSVRAELNLKLEKSNSKRSIDINVDTNDYLVGDESSNGNGGSDADEESADRAYLRQWEERLERQESRLKDDKKELERLRNDQVSSSSPIKVEELLKTLEAERKVRIKLEDQLQQGGHLITTAPSTPGGLNGHGNGHLPIGSPSKGSSSSHNYTNTITSLFSRRNLSIPDFKSGTPTPPIITNSPPSNDQQPSFNSNSSTPNTLQSDYPAELMNLSDEERKIKLFEQYQRLSVACTTALYAKRDQLSDLEKEGGFMKMLNISSIKSAINKLEPLQDRVKKTLVSIDSKPCISIQEDIDERNQIKQLQLHLDSID